MSEPICMVNRNWRGEVSHRTITPVRVYWGTTSWHPEAGWLLQAYDHDKQAERVFALADCDFRER